MDGIGTDFSKLSDTQKIGAFNDSVNEYKENGIDESERKSIFDMAKKWGKQTTGDKIKNMDASNLKLAISELRKMKESDPGNKEYDKAINNLQDSLNALQKKSTYQDIGADTQSTDVNFDGQEGWTPAKMTGKDIQRADGKTIETQELPSGEEGDKTFRDALRQFGYTDSDNLPIQRSLNSDGTENPNGERFVNIPRIDNDGNPAGGTTIKFRIGNDGNILAITRDFDKEGNPAENPSVKNLDKNLMEKDIKLQEKMGKSLDNISNDKKKKYFDEEGKLNDKGKQELAKVIKELDENNERSRTIPSKENKQKIIDLLGKTDLAEFRRNYAGEEINNILTLDEQQSIGKTSTSDEVPTESKPSDPDKKQTELSDKGQEIIRKFLSSNPNITPEKFKDINMTETLKKDGFSDDEIKLILQKIEDEINAKQPATE